MVSFRPQVSTDASCLILALGKDEIGSPRTLGRRVVHGGEMYAGVGGQGAEDASYASAVLLENCKLRRIDATGGAADIFKCFDQVTRELVYELLSRAGLPKKILKAYKGFQESLKAYNTVAGGVGAAYSKPTSVPQGDPMSMMIVALLLRAWIVEMKQMNLKPRVLADDLHVIAVGYDHLGQFQKDFDKTHCHLEAMGQGSHRRNR